LRKLLQELQTKSFYLDYFLSLLRSLSRAIGIEIKRTAQKAEEDVISLLWGKGIPA